MAITNQEVQKTPYNIRRELFVEYPTVAQALVNVMRETHGQACGCRTCLNTQEGILYRQLNRVLDLTSKPEKLGWEITVGVNPRTDRLDVQFGDLLKEFLFN